MTSAQQRFFLPKTDMARVRRIAGPQTLLELISTKDRLIEVRKGMGLT